MRNLLVAAVFVLGGCNLYFESHGGGGGGGSPGGGGGMGSPGGGGGSWGVVDAPQDTGPEAVFDTIVYPTLHAECNACHTGPAGGVGQLFGPSDDPANVYLAIRYSPSLSGCFDPSVSSLIHKGAHEGPALTADQAQNVAIWLDDEFAANGPDQQVGCPLVAPQILAEEQFAACETVSGTDITSSGAAALANLKSSAGTCSSCHSPAGSQATLAFAGTASQMLQAWESQAGLEEVFTTVQDASGNWSVVFDQPRFAAKGQELANGTGTHPSFTLPASLVTAMQQYVTDIDALETQGVCPAPAFQ